MCLRDFYHCSSGMAAEFRMRSSVWYHEQLLCPFRAWSSSCTCMVGILFRKLYCAYSTAFAMLWKLGNKIWKSFNSTYHNSFIQFRTSSSSKHALISGEDQRLQEYYPVTFQVSVAESKPWKKFKKVFEFWIILKH